MTVKEFFEKQLITDANSVIDKTAHKFSRTDLIKFATAYYKSEFKNLDIPCVTNCNFKTVIALYEDADSILAVSEQILPMHKGDKITIKDKYYMVEYVDYDFDKAIFEIVVTDDN